MLYYRSKAESHCSLSDDGFQRVKIHFQTELIRSLPDGSREIYLNIDPEFQIFIGYLLEGLDGFCYHTIAESPAPVNHDLRNKSNQKNKKLLKITVPPAFYSEIVNFLNDLQGYDL